MKTPELIELLGQLIKNDFDKWLNENYGFKLVENIIPNSQEYFFGANAKTLTENEIQSVFQYFQDEYSMLGIGIAITPDLMLIGLAHLTENQRQYAISELRKK